MEYNKNGAIDRYYNLDEILKLNIDNNIQKNIEEKFGRRVFFDSNGSCKIGKLCGLEVNHKLSMLYYIIEIDNKKLYIPTYQSITLVWLFTNVIILSISYFEDDVSVYLVLEYSIWKRIINAIRYIF